MPRSSDACCTDGAAVGRCSQGPCRRIKQVAPECHCRPLPVPAALLMRMQFGRRVMLLAHCGWPRHGVPIHLGKGEAAPAGQPPTQHPTMRRGVQRSVGCIEHPPPCIQRLACSGSRGRRPGTAMAAPGPRDNGTESPCKPPGRAGRLAARFQRAARTGRRVRRARRWPRRGANASQAAGRSMTPRARRGAACCLRLGCPSPPSGGGTAACPRPAPPQQAL